MKAASWGYAGAAVKLVMQLGVQILLARLLGPEEYGVFAIGVMIVSFALFFGDVASAALIPRSQLTEAEIRFATTWQITICATVSLVLVLLADGIASMLDVPRAADVIRWVAPVCVLSAIGGVSIALLRRTLDFRSIQIAQISGYFSGYVLVALPYALLVEASVDALIFAWLVQVLVTSLVYRRAAPHAWRPRFGCANGRHLVSFSAHALVANLGNWSLTNLDRIVLARFFSATEVGLYTTAANLLSTPLSQINATFQQIAFSAGARLGTAEGRAGKAFSSLLALAAMIAGLAYGFTLSAAEPLMVVLYGQKWSGSIPFVQAFSLTLFSTAIAGVVTPLLWAHGAVSRDSRVQAVMTVALLVGAISFARLGVIFVAWWVAALFSIRALILIGLGYRVFAHPFRSSFFGLARIGCVVLLNVLAIATWDGALSAAEASPILRLTCTASVPVVIFVCSVRWRQWLGADYALAVSLVGTRLPKRLLRAFAL